MNSDQARQLAELIDAIEEAGHSVLDAELGKENPNNPFNVIGGGSTNTVFLMKVEPGEMQDSDEDDEDTSTTIELG